MTVPRSILSRQLLPASIAIYTTVAIVAFEGLAVTAALPELAAELGSVRLLPWVITSFLLASAVATAVTGNLIDAIGTSTVFRWTTTMFAVSSIVAAAAASMPLLIGARVVQGAAGGALISVGLAAVALVYPSHLTGRAFAANSNVWGVLGFAGPAVAALLLELGSWRWIFIVMAPLCAVALAAGWRTLPGAVQPTPITIDWLSVGLLVLTVGLVLGAVSNISMASLFLVGGAAVAGALFWYRSRRTKPPLLDPRFVKASPYGHLAAAAALFLAAIGGLSAYLPVYVRGARGGSASLAAWSVLWMTLGWAIAANISGRITDRVPERTVLAVGAILGPVSILVAWAVLVANPPLPAIFAAFTLMGTPAGTVTNSALQLVRRVAPIEHAGRATSAHAFLRTMGMSLGAGLSGGVILAVVATRLPDISAVRDALAGAGEDAGLAVDAATALMDGFAVAHLASLALVAVGLILVFRIYRQLPHSAEP